MAQVQQLVDMGFAEADARRALQQVNSNLEQAIERLLTGAISSDVGGRVALTEDAEVTALPVFDRPSDSLADTRAAFRDPMAPTLPARDQEDRDLNAALAISIRDQRDTLGAGSEERNGDLPCGLRNVGNTCYVNSFLQTLLHINEFRDHMLRYRTPPEMAGAQGGNAARNVPSATEPEAEQAVGISKEEHCIRLASELRHVCAYSLFSSRNCIDPSRLLNELVDERGQKLPIGSQEDVGEFMLKFLDSLEEGLRSGKFVEAGTAADTSSSKVSTEPQAPSCDAPAAKDETSGQIEACTNEGTGSVAAEEAESGAIAAQALVQPASTADEDVANAEAPAKEPAATVDCAAATSAASAPGEASGDQLKAADSDAKEAAGPSPLQPVFFGRQVQVFSYTDNANQGPPDIAPSPSPTAADASTPQEAAAPDAECAPIVSEERSDFLQIFLDVKHKDLYTAWDAANFTEVDYTTPSGATTKASTSIWIERKPRLLFFQLQRVIFDHEKKAQVKLDEAFEFDTTVHADRFLLCNRTVATEAAHRVRQLRNRRKELSDALARFEAYQGRSGLGAEEVLRLAADCLEANAAPAAPPTPASPSSGSSAVPLQAQGGASLENADPDRLISLPEALGLKEDELRTAASGAVGLLRGIRDACHKETSRLRDELHRLAAEIGDAHKDLRRHPYHLHAIWVHQGIAGSGHYWAYLRDWQHDRWIRVDDALVSVVEWEDVRAAAVGQELANTSAYVLVYVDEHMVAQQARSRDRATEMSMVEPSIPEQLLSEIRQDNVNLEQERARRQEWLADESLRQHAEAIFQHYAGLIHQWSTIKRLHDTVGSPHDPTARKFLHDAALLKFELFLYRLHGEQHVWTHLLSQSLDSQKKNREWKEEDQGRVMHFLFGVLRGQSCYVSMLREKPRPAGATDARSESELIPLDMPKLMAQYNIVLIQAHIVDEALQMLKKDASRLDDALATLALVWAKWNLEAEDKFRQNEVLLVMSPLIYNTVNVFDRHRKSRSDVPIAVFQPVFEYFLLLLRSVEWPKSWKTPLITQIEELFPQLSTGKTGTPATQEGAAPAPVTREQVLQHPLTQAQERWEEFEVQRPEPGQEFFERHRSLYAWVMQEDEAIAQEFVLSKAPCLREQPTQVV